MSITPEMARAELARRQTASANTITPDMARAELARRKMASSTQQDLLNNLADKTSTADALKISAGRGMMDIIQGAKQLGLQGAEKIGMAKLGTSETYRKKVNDELALYQSLEENKPLTTLAGRIAGGVVATLPASAISAPARLGMVGKAMASGAGQGAAVGGLQFDPTGEERLQNIAIGGALGGAIPAAGAGIGRVVKGKANTGSVEKSRELGALSQEHGVDLTVPELRGSVGGKYVESVVEKLPGTGYIGFREKQTDQLKNAAENIVDKVGGKSTQDTGKTLLNSLDRRLSISKKIAAKKFDKVEKIAEQQGGKVNFDNLSKSAEEIILAEATLPLAQQNKSIINLANGFLNNEMKSVSFDEARKLRSRLGSEVSRLKKSANTGAVQGEEYAMASKLFDAIGKDLDSFGTKSGGALKQAYQEANKFYKDKVVPFKSDELAKAVGGNYDKEVVIGAFLKPGREELASTLINNVGKKGLQASRAAILNNAMEKASQSDFFNAQLFAKEALRLGKANNVLFSDVQRKSLEGFSKLAKAAERASKFAANPETGSRLAGPVGVISAGSATIYDPLFGLGIAGGLGMAKLMQSNIGRRLLTRAHSLPEKNTNAWNKLLIEVAKLTAPVAATEPNINNLPDAENQS